MSIPILRLDNLSLAYGHVALLEGVALQIDESERVCLVGRNGTGKSTLVRILAGEVVPDDGQVWRRPGLRIAYLSQEVPVDEQRSVFDVVAGGLAEVGDLLAEYHRTAVELAGNPSPRLVERLATLQHELEAGDGWRLEQRVESVLSRLGLPADRPLSELSGGVRRRVLLARALVGEPDLLLLDEPTNHLDIDGITWLEDFLQGYNGALLFITHDRAFLRRLATRIVELDRGHLTSWPGDYDAYLRKREERLAVEAEHQARFDKKLAEEETWIRQGIKARRTRNEGRVRALEALRAERRQRRERMGRANMRLDDGEQSGRLVAELEHVTVSLDGRPVIRDLSTTILRGDRVGIIGPNGAGKTTLLKVILGEFKPDAGTVRLGTRLQTAYFDQQRARLDPERSVIGSLELGGDTVTVGDQTRHVISYLQDFLFPPARARSPVKSLSGGERNRLLLARLFTRPANLLVLDEPTNDLDVETLELLEERLTDYRGTLLLVSHDRAFLDNVVTSTLVFEGNGRVAEYVGGYEDWMRQRPATQAVGVEQKAAPPVEKTAPANVPEPNRPRKLGYKEQRELVALPQRIEALEAEQEQLHQAMADPAFYRRDSAEISAAKVRLEALETELAEAYRRWEALESGPG